MKSLIVLLIFLTAPLNLLAASDLQTDLNAVVQAERDFSKMSVEKGRREAFLTYLAEESAVFLPAPSPGKPAAEKMTPRGELSWYPVYADIAVSGDMGYTTGPWKFRDKTNQNNVGYGEFNSIWKKQPDGKWKNVCDFGIDHPAPAKPITEFQSASLKGRTLVKSNGAQIAEFRTTLVDADRQFSELSSQKGTATAYMLILTPDARMLRIGIVPLVGTKEIAGYFSQKSAQQKWEPSFSDASAAGDLGYTYGSITTEGKADKSYYLRIWKKQSDGTWKVVLDVNNFPAGT